MQSHGFALFNSNNRDYIIQNLLHCCYSPEWSELVYKHMPFSSESHARDVINMCWSKVGPQQWLQAFSAHPRIGDRGCIGDCERKEQSEALKSNESILEAIRDWNQKYDEKFGFIFIICAVNKSGAEILAALKSRFGHHRSTEIAVAAEEQRKIIHIRFTELIRLAACDKSQSKL